MSLGPRERRGLSFLLREYKVGEKVVIDIDPTVQRGQPHRRYQGKIGTIEEVRRRSVVIGVWTGNKLKKIVARLEHVRPTTPST